LKKYFQMQRNTDMEKQERTNLEKYQNLVNNNALQRVSSWIEPNSASRTDEEKIKENAKKIIDVIFGKLEQSVPSNVK